MIEFFERLFFRDINVDLQKVRTMAILIWRGFNVGKVVVRQRATFL
jgi:hypothetical protein